MAHPRSTRLQNQRVKIHHLCQSSIGQKRHDCRVRVDLTGDDLFNRLIDRIGSNAHQNLLHQVVAQQAIQFGSGANPFSFSPRAAFF
jgi:hypothetical protein